LMSGDPFCQVELHRLIINVLARFEETAYNSSVKEWTL
jgi:hypothetical protein